MSTWSKQVREAIVFGMLEARVVSWGELALRDAGNATAEQQLHAAASYFDRSARIKFADAARHEAHAAWLESSDGRRVYPGIWAQSRVEFLSHAAESRSRAERYVGWLKRLVREGLPAGVHESFLEHKGSTSDLLRERGLA